jgi:hypothetical protein
MLKCGGLLHALRSAMRRVWRLPPEERLRDVGPEWFLVLLIHGGGSPACNDFVRVHGPSGTRLLGQEKACPLMIQLHSSSA